MDINLKTSEASKSIISTLTQKMGLRHENIVPRLALAISLSKGHRLKFSDMADNQGKEFKDSILFDDYRDYYLALVAQHYEISTADPDLRKYVKMHIDDGLRIMNQFLESNRNFDVFDYLLSLVEEGVELLELQDNPYQHIKNEYLEKLPHFDQALRVQMGQTQGGEPLEVVLNQVAQYPNCHMAIAGGSGSGKTQFALDLLYQIHQASQGLVHFMYFDFKGVQGQDKDRIGALMRDKFNGVLVDAPHTPFPFNPLSFVDKTNEVNQKMGIAKLVDIIAGHATAGVKQKQFLHQAVREAFEQSKGSQHPTLGQVFELLQTIMGKDSNKLTGTLRGLIDPKVFEDTTPKDYLSKNYYLSLSPNLSNDVRFTATFLIINKLYNHFMNMEDSPVIGDIQAIRYVLLIDEAQNVFKDKKNRPILEKLLREVRSKGVAVVMLSQDLAVFSQADFDFASICQMGFVLNMNNKNPRDVARFLGLSEDKQERLREALTVLGPSQAVSNLRGYEAECFGLSQFKDRI